MRAETIAAGVVVIDKATGKTHFDTTKLTSLPLLLSVYMECLRLYQTIPIIRSLRNNIEVDGYTLRAGNFIMTPSYLAHYNENVWSTPDHPANTFWAERFMQTPGETEESSKNDPGDFIPFGGGLNICPGRHLGKSEILIAVTMMLTKFDFELIGYVDENGRPTTKGPESLNIENYKSRGVIRPHCDVLVRMRKAT